MPRTRGRRTGDDPVTGTWLRAAWSMLAGMETAAGFWARYLAATGAPDGPWQAYAFAEEHPEVATELAALVLAGRKRATAGLHAEYLAEGANGYRNAKYSACQSTLTTVEKWCTWMPSPASVGVRTRNSA